MRSSLLLLLPVALGCASDHPWKMGTVLDAASLQAAPGQLHVYAPSGQPVNQVPAVEKMVPKGTERLIVGADSLFLVDPGAPSTRESKHHRPFHRAKLPARLLPGDEIMYYTAKDTLEIIDSDGNLRQTPIVRSETLPAH